MEVVVAQVGAREGKKVTRSLLSKAKQFLIRWLIICLLCMCHDNLISHGIREGQSLVIVLVEHVVGTCKGLNMVKVEDCTYAFLLLTSHLPSYSVDLR